MKKTEIGFGRIKLLGAVFLLVFVQPAHAGWTDFFKDLLTEENIDTAKGTVSALSDSDVINGLKQALSNGTDNAITSLGKKNGFFKNPKVKIPMPEKLQSVESALRKLKQDELADEFVMTMNRAAEKAVPETTAIFGEAIREMSFDDAKSILTGPDNAATKYFRKTSGEKLVEKILPIVKQATSQVGVTQQYKNLIDQLGFMKNLVDVDSLDLDSYVTDKTVDGLFSLLAKEEKLIRTDPAARTTELLKKVFASQ